MFLRKYLNEFYFDLLLEQYDEKYLRTLDENKFSEIYNLFLDNNFYFVNDIVIRYLELFSLDINVVSGGLTKLQEKLGKRYVYLVGDDMRYLETIL